MLLTWYGQRKNIPAFIQASHALNDAVAQAIAAGESTGDVGGRLGTKETGQALAARLQSL
jgi:3-isopropylmalate dehydrogenase